MLLARASLKVGWVHTLTLADMVYEKMRGVERHGDIVGIYRIMAQTNEMDTGESTQQIHDILVEFPLNVSCENQGELSEEVKADAQKTKQRKHLATQGPNQYTFNPATLFTTSAFN